LDAGDEGARALDRSDSLRDEATTAADAVVTTRDGRATFMTPCSCMRRMFAWTFLLPSASYARMAASRRASSSDIAAVRGHVVAPIDVFSRQTPRKLRRILPDRLRRGKRCVKKDVGRDEAHRLARTRDDVPGHSVAPRARASRHRREDRDVEIARVRLREPPPEPRASTRRAVCDDIDASSPKVQRRGERLRFPVSGIG
jgi:hypothetical protein